MSKYSYKETALQGQIRKSATYLPTPAIHVVKLTIREVSVGNAHYYSDK